MALFVWLERVERAAFVEFPRPLIEVFSAFAFTVFWVPKVANALLMDEAKVLSRLQSPLLMLTLVIVAEPDTAVLTDWAMAETTSDRVPIWYVLIALYWVAVVFDTVSPDPGASGGTYASGRA